MAMARTIVNVLRKRRNLVGIGLFLLLVARVINLHVERSRLWDRILTKYDSNTESPRLNAKDLLQFLQDSGVDVTENQLKRWFGSVDDEKDGYDQGEALKVIEFFDDMESWKGKKRGDDKGNLGTISDEYVSGMSAFVDVLLLFVAGGFLGYFLQNSEAMDKKIAANSFVSAVKVAGMKRKWKTIEGQIEGYDKEKLTLQKKLADLVAENEMAVDRAAKQSDSKTIAEVEAASKKLEDTRKELESVNKRQVTAEAELTRLRGDTEKHITEAHMSSTKLQAMRSMLRGVDAVGAANPFKGAGQGQFSGSGAKTGFALKGRSGSQMLKGDTAPAHSGFRMESFVFGFPTEDDIVFYEVDKKRDLLGEGADCAYKCRDIVTKEQLCVKIYEIKGSAQRRQIVNDLRAKQSIGNHPHIVRYHAVVETEEQIFVLMELIPGTDLFGHVVDRGGLTEKSTAGIFYQLCEALMFCHDHDIIHGDVKPENAMILNGDDEEKIHTKLIDFGFAAFLDNPGEDNKAVADCYSPKEAILGQQSSKAIDSFRLGCTLYVCLMGTYPFHKTCHDLAEREAGNVLKYPKWATLSEGAKDLIVKLCRDRLPVAEAQKHPWVSANYTAPAKAPAEREGVRFE